MKVVERVIPLRVQLSRRKGWRMPANTVKVARPTMFGNPFRIGQLGIHDAAAAVRRFRKMTRRPQHILRADHGRFMFAQNRIVAYLRGKNLACWCPLDQPCHADILLKIANR